MSSKGELQTPSEADLSLAHIVEGILQIERSTGLCDMTIAGFHFWDALRMKFFYHLTERLGIYEKAHRYKRPRITEYAKYLASDFLSLLRAFRKFPVKSGLLVLANARRKQEAPGGAWTDIVTDPVIEKLHSSPLVLEARIGGVHPQPAQTRNLYYYDMLRYIGGIIQPILRFFSFPSRRERENFRRVEAEIESKFGIKYPLGKAAKNALGWRNALVPLYSLVLRRAKARKMLLVCSYGKEAWIEACQRLGIHTIELQHGTITRFHLGYHYPEGTDREYSPDEFWAFGEYWTRSVSFARRTVLRPRFGFPYLEKSVSNLEEERDLNMILAVSQGTIGGQLSRLIVDALAFLPPELRIVYKLHPAEVYNWEKEYPWLVEHTDRIEVIEGDYPRLHALMVKAKWQIGVNSTALFEGMRLGCRTVLADLPGIEYMEDVIQWGAAVLVHSAEDLPHALHVCPEPEGRVFFDSEPTMFEELEYIP